MNCIYPNIAQKMAEEEMDYRQLADAVGMNHLAMYRRLAGLTKMSLTDALAIRKVFHGVDIHYLFQVKEGS